MREFDFRLAAQLSDGSLNAEELFTVPRDTVNELRTFNSWETRITARLEENLAVRRFTQALFNLLIGDYPAILTAYRSALGRKEKLWIRLTSHEAGRLANLPWELMRDPELDFPALSQAMTITRRSPDLSPRSPAPYTLPLRVLVIIPTPPNYPPINAQAEMKHLNEAANGVGRLQFQHLKTATWTALRRQLRQEDYQIIHFIGYSHYDHATRQGFLAFEDEGNISGSRPVSAAELSAELGKESTIRLVIMSQRGVDTSIESNAVLHIANTLLAAGTATALVTQSPFRAGAEKIFNTALYQALSNNVPLDAGMFAARQALRDKLQNLEWASPALFLNTRSAELFRVISRL